MSVELSKKIVDYNELPIMFIRLMYGVKSFAIGGNGEQRFSNI